MTHDRFSRWPPNGSAANAAATNYMIGVFPRHSTRVFKETLTVITLALAFVLVVLAVTVLAPRSAWPQTTMDPAATAQDPWPAGLFFRSGRSDALRGPWGTGAMSLAVATQMDPIEALRHE